MSAELNRAAAILADAKKLVAATGAGMSRDSGVPTFRDAMTGLWSRFDPHELANAQAFSRRPDRVFGWYLWRWNLVHRAEPHAGYQALVRMERAFDDLLVVTQNVDGFHSRSGSRDVVELHGSLEAFRCFDNGHPFDSTGLEGLKTGDDGEVDPPRCSVCGSMIRPGVVWFGEMLPKQPVERAWAAVGECDALLVVGTSAVVYPAAELPSIALRRGCPVIDVNPESTPITNDVDVWVPERAEVALPALADLLLAST
jgi:NAD-dependent deacetylase